MCSVLVGF